MIAECILKPSPLSSNTRATHRQEQGRLAEQMAVDLLVAQGATVLFRNWRRPQGELDIVARHGDTCVFVEVRSRTGTERGHALETVTRAKRAQVMRAARLFLAEEAMAASNYRFDVVAVTFSADGTALECQHVPNAFTTND